METITPNELKTLLANGPGLTVLDVREPEEYDAGHLPEARNEPFRRLDPRALIRAGLLPKNDPVYIVAKTGVRATRAAAKFAEAGYDRVVVVTGGMLAWIHAGHPVVRGIRFVRRERKIRLVALALIVAGLLLGRALSTGVSGMPPITGGGLVVAGIIYLTGMILLLARLETSRFR